MDSHPPSSRTDHAEERTFRRAMALRRWFLILAAPVVLLSTIVSMQLWWDWIRRLLR